MKILERVFFSLAVCLAFTVFSATDDIIKNKDFKSVGPSGLPEAFKTYGKGKLKVVWNNSVNSLEFDLKKGERKILVQSSLALEKGKQYKLTWWVQGNKAVKYMVYIEGVFKLDGKKKWEVFGNSWRTLETEWKQCEFNFTYNSKNPKQPYWAIQVKGPGKLSLKSLSLTPVFSKKKASIDISKVKNKSTGENKVTFNEKNIIEINGKSFYPLFFWQTGYPGSDQQFKQLRNYGLNCFYLPLNSHTSKLLDCAEKVGMKVVLVLPSQFWRKDVANSYHNLYVMLSSEIINHPALLGYCLGDELLWLNVPLGPILEAYKFLKKLDPNHPVWLNAAPRNSIKALAEYGKACDIYGVDIYPVGSKSHSGLSDKGLTSVGKYTLRMRKTVEDKKPICLALQGFSWGVLGKKSKCVYPDLKQTRFMAYDGIINGATLLSWWGVYCIDNIKFRDNLVTVTKELYQITDILTRPNSISQSTCSSKSIEFIEKETTGGKFLIAANTSESKIKAKFKTSIASAKLHVFFENRRVKVKKGVFSDSFAPHAVHVYSTLDKPNIVLPQFKSSNPWQINTKKYTIPYTGKANWIWFPKKSKQSGSKCRFVRKFTLSNKVQDAVLLFAADDFCEVKINGNPVASNSNWTKATKIQVGKLLKTGLNTISVVASDAGTPPCGLLFDLKIAYLGGKKYVIVSDASWQSEDLTTMAKAKAQIVAPYGSGAWSDKVKIPE